MWYSVVAVLVKFDQALAIDEVRSIKAIEDVGDFM